MYSDQEVKDYFKENYEKKNFKRARSVNSPQRLHTDFHKLCVEKGVSMSAEINLFMTSKIMENKKL